MMLYDIFIYSHKEYVDMKCRENISKFLVKIYCKK